MVFIEIYELLSKLATLYAVIENRHQIYRYLKNWPRIIPTIISSLPNFQRDPPSGNSFTMEDRMADSNWSSITKAFPWNGFCVYREENRSIEPVDLGPKSGFRFAGCLPRHRLRLMQIVDRPSFRQDYGFQKKRTILCFCVVRSKIPDDVRRISSEAWIDDKQSIIYKRDPFSCK